MRPGYLELKQSCSRPLLPLSANPNLASQLLTIPVGEDTTPTSTREKGAEEVYREKKDLDDSRVELGSQPWAFSD